MNLTKKYKNLTDQVRASIWYTLCNFFNKGITFLVIPLYVRLLTTDEYGEWSVFQSWAGILLIFASLNLYAGVYTKKLVDMPDQKDRDRYTSSMQGLGTLISIGLLSIYAFVYQWFNKLLDLDTPLVLLLILYFIVYPAFSFWATRSRVEYKYRQIVIVTTVVSIMTPCVSLVLLRYTDLRAKALIIGFLLTQCVVGLFFYVYHFIKGRCFFNKGYWRYAAGYNIPLIPHYLSLVVLGQSDRIMIKYFCGESDAGIYSFAYQIASAISIMISAINGSRVPWVYEQFKAKVYNRIGGITNVLTIMMAGITLVLCLISPEIVGVFGTSDYSVAMYVIPVVATGTYFTFVYDLYASVEFYFGATKYVMYASMTGAVLNLILNVIFIPIFGFIAAAYTTFLCYIVFMMMHYSFSKRILKEQGIKENVYDNKFLFLLSALITALCLASMLTVNFLVIRCVLALIIIMVCIIKRNDIKKMIATIRR